MKNKYFSITLTVSVLLIALSVVYYSVYFLPNKEKNEQQLKEREQNLEYEYKTQKQEGLKNCLSDAKTTFKEHWNKVCKYLGRDDDCIMKSGEYGAVFDQYEKDKDVCFKSYPVD